MRMKLCRSLTLAALAGALHLVSAFPAMADGALTFVPEEELQALESGANVDARLPDGSTALHWAVYRGDVAKVKRLIEAGADVTLATSYGVTPLQLAAERGDPELVRLLLKAGADPESPNAEGQTALMTVARTGNVEAAALLVKAGANTNARENWGGQTALMWAAAKRQPQMVRFLVSKGADVDARSTVRDWPRKVTSEPREKSMDRGGFAALHYAAREGCVECARELVKGGADIDIEDGQGTTPLVLAIMNLRFDVAKYLIEAGADVNLWDRFGVTPLYAAVDVNRIPQGGRPDVPPTDRTTAMDIIHMLLERGANVNAQIKLPLPARHSLAGGRADKRVTNIGATPLMRAALGADLDAMKVLIEHGALVDLPLADGMTPMLAAILPSQSRAPNKTEQDALAAMRLLKEAGADPNKAVTLSDKALHLIHVHGMDEARVRGSTALMMATVRGWTEVMKQLVEWGVDVNATDADGLTALDYAMGRARVGFLQQRPDPRHDLAALLRELGATEENPDIPPWKPLMVPKITARVPDM